VSPFAVADEPASSWRRLLRSRRFRAAAPLLALFVACAVAPGVVAPADPHSCDLARSAAPPVAGHPFGFDPLGCDYLSRVVYGARTSLGVAVLVVGGALLIAIVLGLLAGLRGGALDIAISRFADVLLGVPLVLGGLVVLAVLETRGVLQVSAVLTLLTWPALLRVVRVAVREQQAATFVEAARAMGASELRVAIHHVLAGAVGPVLVYATALSGVVIAAEATLSFMGVGLRLPAMSWGLQLAAARTYVGAAPHLLLPGVAVTLGVLAFVLMGDALRDVLDPPGSSR
jgi:ABC-type dipeptide/oligopeptide/nickel transport system permease subunit